ncbi:MAG: glycosyltransferase family 4 protein [Bacteroidetes bacterium]|nr:glycosyltransferase family 4 protein [Bacteroidota bacterium]
MKSNKKILVVSFQSLTAQSGAGMARLGYYLSAELDKRGLLKDFIVYSKGKHKTTFPSSPVSYWSRFLLFALNKMDKYLHFAPHKFRYVQEKIFDWFCTSKITSDISILFVTQPFLKKTFAKAKRLGIQIVFIPANPEENYINNLLQEERKKLNINEEDAYTYDKRIRFYNTSIKFVDTVIGTYPTVFTTYKNSNFTGEVVEMTGHLKPDFDKHNVDPQYKSSDTFIVGYLAHTVVLKGLQYLLAAWDSIIEEYPEIKAKLVIGGKVDDSMHQYLIKKHLNTDKLDMVGRIPNIQGFMKSLDVFVVPSLIDGGPYTALEAAHYAVPVIITENCGSAELLSRNNSGCKIVPIRDTEGLKKEILWAYNNRHDAHQMGINAKHNLDTYDMNLLISNIADYLEAKAGGNVTYDKLKQSPDVRNSRM